MADRWMWSLDFIGPEDPAPIIEAAKAAGFTCEGGSAERDKGQDWPLTRDQIVEVYATVRRHRAEADDLRLALESIRDNSNDPEAASIARAALAEQKEHR